MAGNRGVAYMGPGKVEIQETDYPTFQLQDGPGVHPDAVGRECHHGVILKIVSTNICGSDQHMVRGRTTAPEGLILGHEITGEIVEKGRDVEFLEEGDLVSIPFNIACGRCRNCKERKTGICLNTNPDRPGAAYGYVDMGGWPGGQAEYVMVPYADFNCLKFPDKDAAMEKIVDLTMLSDIFPTGYHGCVTAGVTTGSTVYVAGAGPVGLAAAHSAQLLGASVVIVGDLIPERLKQAESFGCVPLDVTKGDPGDQIAEILGTPEVDCGVDAVGFEARGHGEHADEEAARDRAQLADDDHPRRRRARHPRALRDRRPGRGHRGGQGGVAVDPHRPRLGEVAHPLDRSVPGHEVPPRADGGDPHRPLPDRQGRQRQGDLARRRAEGLRGLRQGRGREVRARPARVIKA